MISRRIFSLKFGISTTRKIVGLVGLCEDRNSSFMVGAASAPLAIRNQLASPSSNSTTEMGKCIEKLYVDYGDCIPKFNQSYSIISAISPILKRIYEQSEVPLILGGDHSITYSICKTISLLQCRPFKILHFDAHPDLYENFEDNSDSHASPFARILEDRRICSGLTSIGLRTINAHQRDQITKYGVQIVEAKDVPHSPDQLSQVLCRFISPGDRVYVSIDMDVLDPAFAPGKFSRSADNSYYVYL